MNKEKIFSQIFDDLKSYLEESIFIDGVEERTDKETKEFILDELTYCLQKHTRNRISSIQEYFGHTDDEMNRDINNLDEEFFYVESELN
tara:strand:- start:12 stop:278 length:267 start_codon:yes stop_codon:yes gene_type:complete